MTLIRNEDVIQSVADALQYISYYHPIDFITAVNEAYEREESPAAKDAMAQILSTRGSVPRGSVQSVRTLASSRCFSMSAWTFSGRGICR